MKEILTEFLSGKKVLITGAAGTVGSKLVAKLLDFDPSELRLMDNNETELFFLFEEYRDNKNVCCFLGDVRDRDKLIKLCDGIDIVIHCAAFKHVILSEYSPFDTVQTNIIGTENVIMAAKTCSVKHVLFTSSDKAVNPTSVMGTTKLMGERLITAANSSKVKSGTVLSSTRFGNVIGSRGSVLPIFDKQIKSGGPVTLTDRAMSRFIMTPEAAAEMVLHSVALSKGGEVFVTKMPVMMIADLAKAMIELLAPKYGYKAEDIEIKDIGAKAGEKIYEELMTLDEGSRAIELKDMFVIKPAFTSIYEAINYDYPDISQGKIDRAYISSTEEPLSVDDVKSYLIDNELIDYVKEAT